MSVYLPWATEAKLKGLGLPRVESWNSFVEIRRQGKPSLKGALLIPKWEQVWVLEDHKERDERG